MLYSAVHVCSTEFLLLDFAITCYPWLSCLLFCTQCKVQRENLSLLCHGLQVFFLHGAAISDIGGNVHHPRDCLIAIDEAVLTLPLIDKPMK